MRQGLLLALKLPGGRGSQDNVALASGETNREEQNNKTQQACKEENESRVEPCRRVHGREGRGILANVLH